ncbi:MAG TPA: WecB/TagA/CpsF family glycosyltransferase [bacterium]|nr:WecB/TagA/CpsF family glycosyltransferase [bacterium]HQJ65928.1 WecB/TagA/CpsF family glycosyltransferase [bacterium]
MYSGDERMAPASNPAFIHILGSRIDTIPSYRAAFEILLRSCRQETGPAQITVNNAHTMVEGARRPEFRRIINASLLSLADGRPLSLIGWLKGAREMHRIFGPTLLEQTLDWGRPERIRHFFFGNTPETLARMEKVIRQRYPGALIAGMISPPFRAFTEAENRRWLEEMRQADADLIWVSLGAPRQEEWIFRNLHSLDRGLFIGIGAGFSYLAGTIKHAPAWMKYMALEWFYRLLQEPNRLWRRYVKNNTLFIFYTLHEWLTGTLPGGRSEEMN